MVSPCRVEGMPPRKGKKEGARKDSRKDTRWHCSREEREQCSERRLWNTGEM
jgi:hypothetical protein